MKIWRLIIDLCDLAAITLGAVLLTSWMFGLRTTSDMTGPESFFFIFGVFMFAEYALQFFSKDKE